MIDFRYHLVSLVSVFLALAVGIVLGAGPLKEPIGESLQSQVDALRADRDDLRTKIEAANGNLEKQNEFISASSPELLDGILADTKVTLIAAPEANAEQVEDVSNRLTEAGAQIATDVSLDVNTLSLKDAADLLTTIREIVPTLPDDDSTAISTALVIALTGKASTISADAKEREDAVKSASELFKAFVDAGRLRTDDEPAQSQLFAIVDNEQSHLAEETEPSPEATDDKAGRTVVTDFVNGLVKDSQSVVVAGDAGSAQTGLVSVLRTEKSRASTVDGLGLSAGGVITARAVAAGKAGTHGHFGFASEADSILPGKV